MNRVQKKILFGRKLLYVTVFICLFPLLAWGESDGDKKVELIWKQVVDNIEVQLGQALVLYKNGEAEKAGLLVIKTLFDEYKNSLLETAVRRFNSQQKDFVNNADFSHIASSMRGGEPYEQIELRVKKLVKELRQDILGLPLIEGAASEKEIQKVENERIINQDWRNISQNFSFRLQKMVQLHRDGKPEEACSVLEKAYLDIFEGSGMEALVSKKDPDSLRQFSSSFSSLMQKIKAGEPVSEVEALARQMQQDFEKAVVTIEKGNNFLSFLSSYKMIIGGAVVVLFMIILLRIRKKKI